MLYPVTQVSMPVIQWYDRENTNYVIITHVSHKSIKENGSITICALWRKLIYFWLSLLLCSTYSNIV